MKVVEFRQEADFATLRPGWDKLSCESGSNTIFLAWEWITAWWSSYGTPGQLRILAAFDEYGVLLGIAPLRCHTLRKYGQAVTALSFLGDGSDDSDYLDLLIAEGHEKEVVGAFCRHLGPELNNGTVLLLNEIPESSPNLVFLRDQIERRNLRCNETQVDCGTVPLPGSWEDYLRQLRPRFRTKVRSTLRNLETREEVQFGFCENSEQLQSLLPILFDLHTRRWAQDGKPGVFGRPGKRDFYFALSKRLLERGWLRFSWLKWKDRILACQYGFAYENTYFHLQEGYEPASEHWNLGIGLRAWSINQFLKEGLREYDFLAGLGRHKADWGAERKLSNRLLLAHVSHKNVLFCQGPNWESRGRESVKRILPQRILSARQARLEKQRMAVVKEGGNTPEQSATQWARHLAANCYFHLRIPALVRGLRERYQLSVTRNGGPLPYIACRKKTNPTARILIYHRVNDDNDPFFPAISTARFEHEMQFAAKHYRVVTLSALLDHLQGGLPEDVLAVTFDDGYGDNYENAFPVLRRYGLPATIFLTTGSIDSREPMWFEQLALALKRTTQEFIDLEIDLPRRFWLRTEAERVQSNGRLFELLRDLDDPDRLQSIRGIVQQLRFDENGTRRNKMLTWDQIRTMNAQGIDFGGHTVTHPFLAKMTKEQVGWEVSECKRRIEQELKTEIAHFAYPNGREKDFGNWNKEVVRSAGYRAAVTTIWGVNHQSTDPLELRRGQPWEESPALFASKLDWYQLTNE